MNKAQQNYLQTLGYSIAIDYKDYLLSSNQVVQQKTNNKPKIQPQTQYKPASSNTKNVATNKQVMIDLAYVYDDNWFFIEHRGNNFKKQLRDELLQKIFIAVSGDNKFISSRNSYNFNLNNIKNLYVFLRSLLALQVKNRKLVVFGESSYKIFTAKDKHSLLKFGEYCNINANISTRDIKSFFVVESTAKMLEDASYKREVWQQLQTIKNL